MKEYTALVATMAANAPALSGEANLAALLNVGKTEKRELLDLAKQVETIDSEGGIAGRVQLAKRINLDAAFLAKCGTLGNPRGGAAGTLQQGSPLDQLNAVHSMIYPQSGPAAREEAKRDASYASNAASAEMVKAAREKTPELPAQSKAADDAARQVIRNNARTHIGNMLADAKKSGEADAIEKWTAIKSAY